MSNDIAFFSKISPSDYTGRFLQFNEFIGRRQLALLDESDKKRALVNKVAKLKEYAQFMRRNFIESFGSIPERNCPLDAKTVKTIDMGEYIIENVIFCPREKVYLTASLYIPKNVKKPTPAVLFLSGHEDDARMAVRYQEVCQTLASAGLVVFAPDTMGQGERKNFYVKETGNYILKGAVLDHDITGIPMTAMGKFIEGYFMNDQIASVDYMLTRSEIDPERIGVTGCSGGGLQSLCMMACDDRIAAAAPATFTTTRREIFYTGQSQDAEQIWPGCAVYGFDHFEPYMIFAPKPAMILTVSSDFFPVEGAYEVYDEMKRIYSLYGKEDNLEIYQDNACHGYTQPLAEKATDFFCRVFGIERMPTAELRALPIEKFQATRTGNVLGDFDDARSALDENRILAKKLRENRKLDKAKDWLVEKVFKDRVPSKPIVRMADANRSVYLDDYTGKSVMWWVQKRLAAYGVLISKGRNKQHLKCPTVIALWDNGTKAIDKHTDWIISTCESGKQVLVVDLPGVGNIEQAKLWGWSSYRGHYGTAYKMCCDLLYMDDSMAAMQTYHLLRTVDMLKNELSISDVSVYCAEQEGVYGIMAGYLSGVKREYAENLFRSVEKELIEKDCFDYDNNLSYIIPGMLEFFDYDEIM